VEIVTADGKVHTASAEENSDLFWGVKGAASNLGIVTSIEFNLHDIPPVVYGGMTVQPMADQASFVRNWSNVVRKNADTSANLHLANSPNGPVCITLYAHFGDPKAGPAILKPMVDLGPVVQGGLGEMPYHVINDMFVPIFASRPPFRQVWKNIFFEASKFNDELLEKLVAVAKKIQNDKIIGLYSMCLFEWWAGATLKPATSDSAVNLRGDENVSFLVFACWTGAENDAAAMKTVQECADVLTPHSTRKTYSNYTMQTAADVQDSFGKDNVAKLAELKKKFDPNGLFRGALTN